MALESFRNIFSSTPPAAAAPTPDAALEAPVTPETPAAPASEPEVSPMDALTKLWETAPEGTEDPSAATSLESLITIDPDEIAKTVGGMDFASAIPGDTFEAIGEGGEGAQKAFSNALNTVAQQVFQQAMIANATLTKQALSNAVPTLDRRAEATLKRTQVAQQVSDANPVLSHPSFKPMISAIESQLVAKYPTATPAEISAQANSYFADFADKLKAQDAPQVPDTGVKAPTDFSGFELT